MSRGTSILTSENGFLCEIVRTRSAIIQTQNQLVGWIFTIHGGGIAGLLAYAASKPASASLKAGVISFSAGLVLIVLYGTFMYYLEDAEFRAFRRNVTQLRKGEIEWPEFARRDNSGPDKHWQCVVLGWLSGLAGFAGVIFAAIAIL